MCELRWLSLKSLSILESKWLGVEAKKIGKSV